MVSGILSSGGKKVELGVAEPLVTHDSINLILRG
jgi:hypothetical protein